MSAGLEADLPGDEVFIRRFPVHRACRDGDVGALVSLVQQLSDQAPLTAEDPCCGWTPLHWAAHCGQLECVVHLVQMGCEVNTVSSRFNQTPTHTAAFGGHPHCVVWLTQAGADVNKQDFVGEAPIHKAARSGSLECVQALLIAGAKLHLRNASGQTAADLAHAHGFHDCFCFISNAQKQLQQLAGLHATNGNSAPWGPAGRKRQLTTTDTGHMKKARRADSVLVPIQSSSDDEVESMTMESAQELSSDDTKADNPHQHTRPSTAPELPNSLFSPPSPPVNQQAAAAVPSQRASAEMCGSLHLSGSPTSCVSHLPAWWVVMGADCGDFLHYGHYHGFGDTAEELSDSSRLEHATYKQAVAGSVHLYHAS